MARRGVARDPWRDAPTGELQDQVLPRWFVVTGLVMVPLALLVAVGAVLLVQRDDVPPAARRPPPADGLTTRVGELAAGPSAPVAVPDPPCPELAGIRLAGSDADRAALRRGLEAVCRAELDEGPRMHFQDFSSGGGVVRFAQFADTGVDSTATDDGRTVYVNARFSVTEPAWIAPLLVHDVITLAGEPGTVETALAARREEAGACAALFADTRPSLACADAAAVVDLPDPAAALRDAGYR